MHKERLFYKLPLYFLNGLYIVPENAEKEHNTMGFERLPAQFYRENTLGRREKDFDFPLIQQPESAKMIPNHSYYIEPILKMQHVYEPHCLHTHDSKRHALLAGYFG